MISYRHDGLNPFRVTVKLDGKTVGHILHPARDQYHYRTRSGVVGDTFDTLEGVKESLEAA